MFSPLEQFIIHPLLISMFSVFNVGTFLLIHIVLYVLIILSIFAFFIQGLNVSLIKTTVVSKIFEQLFLFVLVLLKQVKNSTGIKFFPYFFSLFVFILLCNVAGLLPYSFTITSQILVTFSLSLSTFIGINLIGVLIYKFTFVNLFIPFSVPNLYLRTFLVFIEVLSYLIRPLSLGIRLFANMLAGHILLNILSTFSHSFLLKDYVV